uniref:BLOC-1-related complex subunit 5 n=1 Tax=Meloidogyne hapla TaxID=6305 RepID=A0A1I8BEP5_MELHA
MRKSATKTSSLSSSDNESNLEAGTRAVGTDVGATVVEISDEFVRNYSVRMSGGRAVGPLAPAQRAAVPVATSKKIDQTVGDYVQTSSEPMIPVTTVLGRDVKDIKRNLSEYHQQVVRYQQKVVNLSTIVATKDDIKDMAKKEDIKDMATKQSITDLEKLLTSKIDGISSHWTQVMWESLCKFFGDFMKSKKND